MPNRFDRSISHIAFGTVLAVMAVVPAPAAVAEHGDQAASPLSWESAAHWHHGLTKTPGTLALTDSGIEFRAAKGPPLRWPFVEIQTFDLSSPADGDRVREPQMAFPRRAPILL